MTNTHCPICGLSLSKQNRYGYCKEHREHSPYRKTRLPNHLRSKSMNTSLSTLEKNELFIYKNDMYRLVESVDSVIKEQNLESFDITNGKLNAVRVAFKLNDKWIGTEESTHYSFWADSSVTKITF